MMIWGDQVLALQRAVSAEQIGTLRGTYYAFEVNRSK